MIDDQFNKFIDTLSHWTKDTCKGCFRYPVGANVCYEIFITKCYAGVFIEQAQAIACVTGTWEDNNGLSYFSREVIAEGTVQDCVNAVTNDYLENMK